MEDYAKIVGGNLHDLRIRFGLSAAKFSRDIGCTYNSLRHWERGDMLPSSYYLPLIADRFHVSIDYLFGRER